MAATADLDVRSQFPTLAGREGIAYLDSAATSQTPDAVLAAMDAYYREHRASVHRGVYPLAAEATDLFEGARASRHTSGAQGPAASMEAVANALLDAFLAASPA